MAFSHVHHAPLPVWCVGARGAVFRDAVHVVCGAVCDTGARVSKISEKMIKCTIQ